MIHNLNTKYTQFLVTFGKVKKKAGDLSEKRFRWGEQQEPTCVERQDTHEAAFLHGSSLQHNPPNLPVWDFPPGVQLRSLISPKMQMSNHICHIFFDD